MLLEFSDTFLNGFPSSPLPPMVLTITAVLFDGIGRKLDGIFTGVLLGEHQFLDLTLGVQYGNLEYCGGT